MKTVLDLLKAIKFIKAAIEWLQAYLTKKSGEARAGKAAEAEKKIDEANKIEDDKARLEAKAKAAKELEDALKGK